MDLSKKGLSLARRAATVAAAAAIAATGALMLSPQAQAATPISKQIIGKAINMGVSRDCGYSTSSYDVTGDGKADSFAIKKGRYYNYKYEDFKVYVNGKKALALDYGYGASAWLMRLRPGKVFVFFRTWTDNEDSTQEGVYTYRNGRFVLSLDTHIWPSTSADNFRDYHSGCNITHSGVRDIRVAGNKVKIKFANMTTIAGTMLETFAFKRSGDKLKMTSRTTKAVSTYEGKTLTAATAFKIYGKPSSKDRVSTIAAGTKVTLKAVQLRPADHFVSVKVRTAGGKLGWITYKSRMNANPNGLHFGTLFQETGMAG